MRWNEDADNIHVLECDGHVWGVLQENFRLDIVAVGVFQKYRSCGVSARKSSE